MQCGRRVRSTRYAPPVCNPDLWPFDLETDMRVASKVGNIHSKFGHARPLSFRIIRYIRDGRSDRLTNRQTDRRADKSNAYCPLPYGRGHNNSQNSQTPPTPIWHWCVSFITRCLTFLTRYFIQSSVRVQLNFFFKPLTVLQQLHGGFMVLSYSRTDRAPEPQYCYPGSWYPWQLRN